VEDVGILELMRMDLVRVAKNSDGEAIVVEPSGRLEIAVTLKFGSGDCGVWEEFLKRDAGYGSCDRVDEYIRNVAPQPIGERYMRTVWRPQDVASTVETMKFGAGSLSSSGENQTVGRVFISFFWAFANQFPFGVRRLTGPG
jgi:hypothetical protein